VRPLARRKQPPPPPVARHPELEQRLRERPDEATFLVYADWLAEQGDPRGELAMAQHRGDSQREREILEAHGGFLAGVPADIASVTWRLGTWRALRVHELWGWKEGPKAVPALAALLLDQPAACGLQELYVGFLSPRRNQKAVPALVAEAASRPFAPWLRLLRVSPDSRWPLPTVERTVMDNAHFLVGDLGSLSPFERLEVLQIWGYEVAFGDGLRLPRLRELTVQTCGLSKRAFEAIAGQPWPELRELELWLGSRKYGGRLTIRDLVPLLEGGTLPQLERLALRNAELTNELAAAIVRSPLLPRLRELDLSMGLLDDEGAQTLLDAADSWRHLERLNVSQSYLSEQRLLELSQVGPSVEGGFQKQDEELARYVSVWE
jgi:uncharacterized protein (TIGR02996 family)